MAREEMISPELQRSAIEQWATSTGHAIGEGDWIEDLDKTGRNFKRRIMEAIHRIESRDRAVIAVWKYSRFGRSREGCAANLARVETAGGQLYSATESVDASTATGKLQRGILMEFNAYESDRASEQWREAHEYRRKAGLPSGGGHRLGYIWHPRRIPDGNGGWTVQNERYEINPDTAPVLADMYERYAAGLTSAMALARELNAAGIRNPRYGRPWDGTSVMRMLDSGFAAGLLHAHDPDTHCAAKTETGCHDRAHYLHLPGAHPPLISPEAWERYQARRDAIARRMATRHAASIYMLTGLIRCGFCRGGMQVQRSRPKQPASYRCASRAKGGTHACVGSRVRMVAAHAQVREWVMKIRVELDSEAQRQPVPQRPSGQDPAAVRARLVAEEVSLTRAMTDAAVRQAKEMTRLPEDVYAATVRQLAKERERVQADLRALPSASAQSPGIDAFATVVQGLDRDWDELDEQTRRSMLSSLAWRIVVYEEKDKARTVRDGIPCRVVIHSRADPDPWV